MMGESLSLKTKPGEDDERLIAQALGLELEAGFVRAKKVLCLEELHGVVCVLDEGHNGFHSPKRVT